MFNAFETSNALAWVQPVINVHDVEGNVLELPIKKPFHDTVAK